MGADPTATARLLEAVRPILEGLVPGPLGEPPLGPPAGPGLDTGPAFAAPSLGARMALALYDAHQAWEMGLSDLEDGQARDAIVRALGVAEVAAHALSGDASTQVQTLMGSRAGRWLVGWLGAVELGLAFATDMEPLEPDLAEERARRWQDEAESALGGVTDEARALFLALLPLIDGVIQASAAGVADLARALREALPALALDDRAGLAAEPERLAVYGLLLGGLLAELRGDLPAPTRESPVHPDRRPEIKARLEATRNQKTRLEEERRELEARRPVEPPPAEPGRRAALQEALGQAQERREALQPGGAGLDALLERRFEVDLDLELARERREGVPAPLAVDEAGVEALRERVERARRGCKEAKLALMAALQAHAAALRARERTLEARAEPAVPPIRDRGEIEGRLRALVEERTALTERLDRLSDPLRARAGLEDATARPTRAREGALALPEPPPLPDLEPLRTRLETAREAHRSSLDRLLSTARALEHELDRQRSLLTNRRASLPEPRPISNPRRAALSASLAILVESRSTLEIPPASGLDAARARLQALPLAEACARRDALANLPAEEIPGLEMQQRRSEQARSARDAAHGRLDRVLADLRAALQHRQRLLQQKGEALQQDAGELQAIRPPEHPAPNDRSPQREQVVTALEALRAGRMERARNLRGIENALPDPAPAAPRPDVLAAATQAAALARAGLVEARSAVAIAQARHQAAGEQRLTALQALQAALSTRRRGLAARKDALSSSPGRQAERRLLEQALHERRLRREALLEAPATTPEALRLRQESLGQAIASIRDRQATLPPLPPIPPRPDPGPARSRLQQARALQASTLLALLEGLEDRAWALDQRRQSIVTRRPGPPALPPERRPALRSQLQQQEQARVLARQRQLHAEANLQRLLEEQRRNAAALSERRRRMQARNLDAALSVATLVQTEARAALSRARQQRDELLQKLRGLEAPAPRPLPSPRPVPRVARGGDAASDLLARIRGTAPAPPPAPSDDEATLILSSADRAARIAALLAAEEDDDEEDNEDAATVLFSRDALQERGQAQRQRFVPPTRKKPEED